MTKQIFEVARGLIPIVGTDQLFPVRRIYCIGRNYAAHAREMGSDPTREAPFFFQKPGDSVQVVMPGETAEHPYPSVTKNYHYEVELVAALGKGGRNIPVDKALDCVFGYAVGLDMTRRDLQSEMKDGKKPWDIGKGFDNGAPVGPVHPAAQTSHFKSGEISLFVNGVAKQKADMSQMIWSVAEQISRLSQLFEMKAGDLVMSGTPENVGPVIVGDTMVAKIAGLPDLTLKIVKPTA